MGILDDAIREHLELKRQHGADSDDVERLEKEAFGPPTRPGDPEFDTSEEKAAGTAVAGSEEPTTVAPQASTVSADEALPERESEAGAGIFDAETSEGDDDWLSSLEDVVEPPALGDDAEPGMPTESVEQPLPPSSSSAPETAESALPAPVEPDTGAGESLSPAEQARIEHADLGDTVAHEAIPDPAAAPDTGEQASEPSTDPGAVAEPPEPPESAIFDGDDDLDLDLDLDIDEAEEASAPRSDDPAAGTGPAVEEPQVGRSVPVEPDSEELAIDPDPTSGEIEIPRADTDEFEADDAEEDELEDDDEDLLEETPDFLQDTPEGDRLWFEQSGPKDFDFEDDDKD